MFRLGPLELLIVAVIAVVLFVWRLPAVGRSLERGIMDYKQGHFRHSMTRAPKRRWFRLGEPWGLLAKTNPKATTSSVLRRAIVVAATGAGLFGMLIYFRTEPTPSWQIKIALWGLACGFLGALFEWQVDDDSL